MSNSDFLDGLFESMAPAAGQIPASQQLRNFVLIQTTRTIRRRRRLRRAGIAAALVGCYLGGVATVSLQRASHETRQFVAESSERVASPVARQLVQPEDDQNSQGNVPTATSRPTPYERLRRAGDRRLEKYADIPGATRNYQKALGIASSDQRRIAPERDTWLLMALKHSSNHK